MSGDPIILVDGVEIDDDTRDRAAIARLALTDEERAWSKIHDDGTLDMPISFLRRAAEWLRRYDMRPRNAKTPRGYADHLVMTALAVAFPVVIAACWLTGWVIDERDLAVADRDRAEHSEDVCLTEWGKTVARSSLLRARITAALDAEEDKACACWEVEAP